MVNDKRNSLTEDRRVEKKDKQMSKKLAKLTKGLNVDIQYVKDLLEDKDWITVSRILGFHISNYDNLVLSGRMIIYELIKHTPKTVIDYANALKHRFQDEVYDFMIINAEKLQEMVDAKKETDLNYDFFSACALLKNYLSKPSADADVCETPRHMWLRIAVALFYNDGFDKVKICFDDLCDGYYVPASPTIFNAGMKKGQLASCFLLTVEDDLKKIIRTGVEEAGLISKNNGGLGMDVSRLRHSEIGSNGMSNGVVPWIYMYDTGFRAFKHDRKSEGKLNGLHHWISLYNSMTRSVDQGSKRKGAATVFLRPHHYDIFEFCEMTLKSGDQYMRAHDINTSIWTSWIFWERVKKDEDWVLFCPAKTSLLNDTWGLEFEKHYLEYEKDMSIKQRKTVKARKLLDHIVSIQRRSGNPYLMNADAVNMKSNQQNLGYIRSSNLCVSGDTMILTDKGYHRIEQLEGKIVNVFNGDEFSETQIVKTGIGQPLMKVELDNGVSINCTPYHKFLLRSEKSSYGPSGKLIEMEEPSIKDNKRIEACDLKPGMELRKFEAPILKFVPVVESNYTEGFIYKYYEDFPKNKNITFSVYKHQSEILDHLEDVLIQKTEHGDAKVTFNIDELWGYVPINASKKDKLEFLSGLIDSCGKPLKVLVHAYYKQHSVIIGVSINISKDNASIFYLLQSLGIESSFDKNSVDIDHYSLDKLIEMGLKLYHFKINDSSKIKKDHPRWNSKHLETFGNLRVSKVIFTGEIGDTYCFTEPKNNSGVFNGVLTGQCQEVCEYSSSEEIPSCNLSSISLRMFVKQNRVSDPIKDFNFEKLEEIMRKIVVNLNKVIDVNYYPMDKIKLPNLKNRPIGIGVSGLAELLHELDLPFCSLTNPSEIHPTTRKLNKMIFACMYFNALVQSIDLAIKEGPYSSFHDSPTSKGILQFDMWKSEYELLNSMGRIDHKIRKAEDDIPIDPKEWNQSHIILSNGHVIENSWDSLKEAICKFGLRNSLLIALMPTASSAQIIRNTETVESGQSNIYSRKVLKGNYPVVNRYLVWDLEKINLWNRSTVDLIQGDKGSISKLSSFVKNKPDLYPKFVHSEENFKRLEYLTYKYKSMWEISTKVFLTLASDRGRYVCQSQSSNIYFADPTDEQLIACHLYAYNLGLKTLCYYLRELPATEAIKFTVDQDIINFVKDINVANEKEEENKKVIAEKKEILVSKKEGKMKCTDEVCISCQ